MYVYGAVPPLAVVAPVVTFTVSKLHIASLLANISAEVSAVAGSPMVIVTGVAEQVGSEVLRTVTV